MKRSTFSPWGAVQSSHVYAEGIESVSTAGHGGILLSPERMARVREIFREFETFAGGAAFEEDQDWSVVALAFPDVFDDQDLRAAVRTAKRSAEPFGDYRYPGWESVAAWLETDAAASILARVDAFAALVADMWEAGSGGTPPRGYPRGSWGQSFTRPRDGERRYAVLREIPTKAFYTDAEIDALTVEPCAASGFVSADEVRAL